MAQFGSFEFDRCLRQIKGERKGAAVEISHRFKVIEISGTARVSCVAALLRKQQSILQIQHKLIFRGVAQFGSFEFDRCLRQIKGERKGAAVEISHRFKVIEISGTARVSCVAALLRKQ